MQISDNELWLLSYYRESELSGALLFGKLARRTNDDDLRIQLTRHCADEAMHAWLWTRTILEVGGVPRQVAETYQNRYCREIGLPKSMLEILAMTQVFEKRVLEHFREHLERPGTLPAVAATLRTMIDDERGHVDWIRERLNRHAELEGSESVETMLRRFEEIDRRIYADLSVRGASFRDVLERSAHE